jgi:hypothetical protein
MTMCEEFVRECLWIISSLVLYKFGHEQVLYEGCSIVKFVDALLDSGIIDMSIMYIADLVMRKKDHIFF